MLLPVVDHHFVEREPGHRHVTLSAAQSLSAAEIAHQHPYQHSHAHSASGVSRDASAPAPEQNPQILFLPGHDLATTAISVLSQLVADTLPCCGTPALQEVALVVQAQNTPQPHLADIPYPPPRQS